MTNALTIHQPTNAEVYRASTDAAGLCREIVLQTAVAIQGRKYVKAEGWLAIAIAHGCIASAEDVQRVEDEGAGGYRAVGVIRRMSDGAEISRAEGFLGDDETMWAKRPVYARRAMCQTRAISRACRSAFAHVVVLIDANLSTTPAEEVPVGGFDLREQLEASVVATAPTPISAYAARKNGMGERASELEHAITDQQSPAEAMAWRRSLDDELAAWPPRWREAFDERFEIHVEELRALAAKLAGADEDGAIEEADDAAGFPGDRRDHGADEVARRVEPGGSRPSRATLQITSTEK